VLVQLRQRGGAEDDLAGASRPCPDKTGGPTGACGLAPMTGTIWPSIFNVPK